MKAWPVASSRIFYAPFAAKQKISVQMDIVLISGIGISVAKCRPHVVQAHPWFAEQSCPWLREDPWAPRFQAAATDGIRERMCGLLFLR
jgi:hypothetical protein